MPENLKKLMGSAYKDGITVEEIDAFLANGNYVNLKDGKYVDKEKYDRVVSERDAHKSELDEANKKYKDYDTIKAENDQFKAEKSDNELKTKLVNLGISESSFKYVKGDITDKVLTLGDDENANKTAVENYLKEHPQFAAQQQQNQQQQKVIGSVVTNPPSTDNTPKQVAAQPWNQNRNVDIGK